LTGFLGIKGRDTKKEELDVTDTTNHWAKSFQFGVKAFCRCIGRAVGEV